MSSQGKSTPEKKKVKPIPEGHHSVNPNLCVKGAARAIEFYKKALGAAEVMRLRMPDGSIGHAEIQIGDSRIMLSEEFPDFGNRSPQSIGGTPVSVLLDVPDVDSLAARVSAAGVMVKVTDQDYGDRNGGFTDPFGHKWIISTHKEDVTFAEYLKRMAAKEKQGERRGRERAVRPAKPATPWGRNFHTVTPYLTVLNGAQAIEFYKQAFGATENESMRFVDPDGRIAHAEFTVGDSLIMLNDESQEYGKRGPRSLGGSPVIIGLSVEDVDPVVARAVAAGAKVLIPVEDQFYGDRSGRLEDPFGHLWIISTHIEDVSPEEIERRTEAFMKRRAGGV